ncbi:hypothetical protein FPOAC1_002006 [Fusarium poae]|uniref:Prion-inhibition and propagation HeLo domain-containing protein n=1 Tax=Fusarium poae TaxID=36050 RepID=A0A1B8B5I6_FUSPO|nr:hypothetical protein FPOAC1_002006 [Fusarium poae]KAG8676010.1 hypothetical protein FPOAC1_002006 [Fusarium poae]OBS27976.1 hypothetical protein FPOA_01916 [Fusarium poae]
MGNFGTAVTSLLDTYTKCLSLLKGTRNHDDGASSDTHSTLSASLRSDRARVRRVYASRLSKDGSQFERGDAPARSALRRIVKKLTTTLTSIVSHDGKRQPVRYESLLALSNGSSIEAVRTMNDLSSRVGSRSTISQSSVTPRTARGIQVTNNNHPSVDIDIDIDMEAPKVGAHQTSQLLITESQY